MNIRYLFYLSRYIKEGFSYFTRLPLHLFVFGSGVSVAILLFLIWQKIRRKEELKVKTLFPLASLVFYLVLIFMITTLSRTPGNVRRHNLRFFHTLREILTGSRYALRMAFFNLVLLFPLGLLMPFILEFRCNLKDILFMAFLVSFSIECTQYLFRLGLMETDDVLNNCLGALFGYILAFVIRKILNLFENGRTKEE